MSEPGRYFDNNVAKSARLIDAGVRGGVRNIVFSSCSVYGTPTTVPVDEHHDIHPPLNLGTGIGSSVFDVVAGIERITGCSVPIQVNERRPGVPSATYADPRLAERLLGWKSKFDLDVIIATAAHWHERTMSDATPTSPSTAP